MFTAKDLASGTMRKVEGRYKSLDATTDAASKNFSKNVGTMVAGMGLVAAGAVGIGVAVKAAGKFGEFDAALAKMQGRLGRTSEEMRELEERAVRAGIETQFSPTEAVQGLEELGAKGLNATDQMSALQGVLDLAAAGNLSVAQSASTVSAAMNVFGKTAEEATGVADSLLKVTSLTALSADDMELAMGNLSRGVSQTNQQFEEMLVLTGLVKNTGVDVSVASSSISSALLAVGKNSDKFRKLGIEVTKADGTFRSLTDIMADSQRILEEKFPDAADRAKGGLELFTKFGLTSFGAIMKQVNTGLKDANGNVVKGTAAVEAYIQQVRNAQKEGFGAQARAAKEATLPGQLTLLKGSLQTLAIEVGRAFSDVFLPIVSAIRGAVNAAITFIKNMPPGLKKLTAGIFVAVSALVGLAGAIIAGAGAFALIKTAVIAFAPVLLIAAKVIGIVVVAGLALIGIFKTLKMAFDENIGGFGKTISETFGKVKLFFEAVKQLTSGDGKLRGNVLQKLLAPANKGVLTMVQRFQQLRFRITKFVGGIKEGFMTVIRSAKPTFTALGEAVKELFAAFGFGSKGLELFTSKSEDYADTGRTFGRIIGEVARFIINGLTVAIRIGTGAVHGFKAAWKILGPILNVALTILMAVVKVFEFVLSAFVDVTEAGNKQGGMWDGLAKGIGYALGIYMAFKSAILIVRGAMLVYRATMAAVAIAQAAFGAIAGASSLAFLGPVGLVVAVGAAAYALGSWLDEMTGASDAIADWMADISGLTAELNKLDEAYRKTIKTRGQVRAFDSIDAAAKAAGMTTGEYIQQRSSEIAGEQTAQRLGLDQSEIARRLATGEDVYKELSQPKPPAAATDGQVSKADGEANKAKAAQRQTEDAFASALQRADNAGKPMKFEVKTYWDGQEVAKAVKKAQAGANADDFEVSTAVTGAF